MLRFTKVQGLGNDFLLVREAVSPADAVALCDRRFGVGGDGVLMVLPPQSAEADAKMRILNADGSEAEMCGNGIRCVAKELVDGGLRKDVVRIETGAGILDCRVEPGPDGRVDRVAVEMGRPRRERERTDEPLEVAGRTFAVTTVSMGNPHAVTFLEGQEPLRALAETYGPQIEQHPWFPRRTNAEFARVEGGGRRIELVVWERGCGITLACGTGACATAAAAVMTGRAPAAREIEVALPGGELGITVAPDLTGVTMRGPARVAFTGTCDPAALRRARPPTG